MQNNWLEIARAKFGNVPITAHGRFALCSLDACGQVRSVYLLDTAEHARKAALGIERAKIVDLELTPSPSCPLPRKERADDAEDRAWMKRQSRA